MTLYKYDCRLFLFCVFDVCFRIIISKCRSAVSRVPALLFAFTISRFLFLYIYLQKSPGGLLKNNATLHFATSNVLFANLMLQNGVRLKGSPFFISLYDFYIVVFLVVCVWFLFRYGHFHMPQRRFSCTCVFFAFTISWFSFLYIDLQTSPGGSLQTRATYYVCNIECFFCNMDFEKRRAAQGVAVLWIYMTVML